MKRGIPLLLFFALSSAAAASAAGEGKTAPPPKAAQLHFLRGLLDEHSGAMAQALQEYEEALKVDPRSPYLAREAAEAALEVGNADKALDWAKAVEQASPDEAGSQILLGRVLWARGDTEEAQAAFEKALSIDPGSVESVLSLSSLLGSSDPERAKKLLSDFIRRDPEHAAEGHFQIAKIDLQRGDAADARKHLKQAIEIEPDESSLSARYALAQSYEVEHATDAALGQYLEIANLEPDNVSLLDHIGEIYLEQDDEAHAQAVFEQAKRVQESDPAANHWLAAIAEKKENFAKAASYLRASAALPEEATLNLRLSYYLTQAGRLPEAVKVLEQAHARWPTNDQVEYFLALGYDDLKQEEKALKLLRQIVAVKPDYREARFQLGVILEKLDMMGEAETHFRALLADSPNDAAVLNYLGYSLVDRGLKLPEAEGLIQKAVELDPKNGAYQDSLGWAHYKQGRSTEAVAELAGAVRLLPEDDTVWEHVGDAYAAAGDQEQAWLSWKRSQSLAQASSDSGDKARKIQRRFRAEELGALYQDYLAYGQDGIRKLEGLCRLGGVVLGHSFSYDAMVHFKAPDELEIELLGPFFSPMLRMRVAQGAFSSDPIRIPGVPAENVSAAASASLQAMEAYLSGRAFSFKPARYHRTFWRRRKLIEAQGWRLELDRAGVLVWRLSPPRGPVSALELGDFARDEGRFVPKTLTVLGPGFRLGLEFTDVKIDLAPLQVPVPRQR